MMYELGFTSDDIYKSNLVCYFQCRTAPWNDRRMEDLDSPYDTAIYIIFSKLKCYIYTLLALLIDNGTFYIV